MSNPAPQTPDATTMHDAPDPAILCAERQLGWLAELGEIGMDMARALGARARLEESRIAAAAGAGEYTIDDPNVPAGAKGRDPAELFGPISRAIRMTIALEAKAERELRDLKAGVVRERAEKTAKARTARIVQIHDAVHGAFWAETEGEDESDELWNADDEFEEVYDGLEILLEQRNPSLGSPERPLREVVEIACRDLRLDPDWSQWTGEGWPTKDPPLRRSLRPSARKAQSAGAVDAADPMPPAPSPAPEAPIRNGHDLQ